MKEWIDFHLVVGVEHFYLYNNESTDNYKAVLEPYIKKGIVELFEWPHLGPKKNFAFITQAAAYQDAINKTCGKSRWLAMIDLDEFMVPREGDNILAILNKHFSRNVGIAMYWRMFGTSNIYELDPTKLMIEQLTMAAKIDSNYNSMFKCIVYPEFVDHVDNPHFAHYKYGHGAVNTLGIPTDPSVEKQNYTIDLIQLNHYVLRDMKYLIEVKWPRLLQYNPNKDWDKFIKSIEELNLSEDFEILRFVQKINSLEK